MSHCTVSVGIKLCQDSPDTILYITVSMSVMIKYQLISCVCFILNDSTVYTWNDTINILVTQTKH